MIVNLANLNVVKTVSIQDVVNAAAKASKNLSNLLKLLLKRRNMFLNGKSKIEKNDLSKVGTGILEIWKKLVRCLLMQLENIFPVKKERKIVQKEDQNGKNKTLKNVECMTEQCMLSKQENLLDRLNVQNAEKNVNLKPITKIIQNLTMSFGFVLNVIFIYITNQNITLREQARKHRKMMRCSDLWRKPRETSRNEMSALEIRLLSNRMWQAGGKAKFIYLPPGYNNDPLVTEPKQYVDLKSSLMDLNLLPDNAGDNKAQASERIAA
jgi:hypothetical protein